MKLSNFISCLIIITVSALVNISCDKSKTRGSDDKGAEILTPESFVARMGLGWNLGNSLDAWTNGKSNETCWGNPRATQTTFDAVKAMGFSTVRIPVTWMGHIGPAPSYTIEKVWMDRVAEVVAYAHKAGLNVIINIHHDGSASKSDGIVTDQWLSIRRASQNANDRAEITARFKALWSQIAARFKSEGDYLIFETMNEVHDGDWGTGANLKDGGNQYEILNSWNQTALDAIREAGGENTKRIVAVAGYAANIGLTVNALKLPNDKVKGRLVVAVHNYDPWDFAGLGTRNEWGTYKDKVEYDTKLNPLPIKYINNSIPVYMGECGCVHRNSPSGEQCRKEYLEYTIKAMHKNNIPPIIWDNGADTSGEEAFGLVNHGNGKYIGNGEEIVKLMVDSWNN